MPLSADFHWLNGQEVESLHSTPQVPVSHYLAWGETIILDLHHPRKIQSEPQSPQQWLTDQILFHYQRCSRRAFLDLYGDDRDRNPPSDYLLKLRQDSAIHRQSVISQQPSQQPHYAPGDWQTGAAATLELMRRGADRIARAVLMVPGPEGFHLVSNPDLLIKQPGQSYFGDWLYVPADIKLGKRPKRDYQITAAYHAQVLAIVQGAWPETSWLILRENRHYAVNLEDFLPRMHEVLQACIETLQAPQQEPEVFIAHNRCDLCHWFDHCYNKATTVKHLSLLPGVTPTRYEQLLTVNIRTVEALAIASPTQLAGLPGFGLQVAQKLIHQSQAVLHNRAIAYPTEQGKSDFSLAPTDLPTAPVELYFDIEAAPEQNLVYLHGVLVVDQVHQTETFHAFLAETVEDERQVWEEFLELVWCYPEAPIYHFCPYEAQTVQRLSERYGAPAQRVDPLLRRFVDLHDCVTRSVTLPVESYALKHIARWIGFDWRDPEANGAQSICWYADWIKTGDRTFLEAILRYNEDDCRATYRLKDWLVGFAQQFWSEGGGESGNFSKNI